MLSPTQLAAREGRLTASRVACLMTGDKERVLNLWREMVGDPDYVEEDLSDNWAVQLGSCTEGLNLDWYERKHGAVTRRGEVVLREDWQAATLDGWANDHPIECKHVGGWEKLDVIVARYQPQMHWQMLVTGAPRCALSVIVGASEPVVEIVPFNKPYAIELRSRAWAFMQCVRTLVPPVVLEPAAAPIPHEKMKTYDMTGDNHWASEAVVWLEHCAAAKLCRDAEKEIKGLVPIDAARAHGHGVVVTRNKAGHLSLKEYRA